MPFELMLRATDEESIYIRSLAARMARVSINFLIRCEEEGLVNAQVMTGGGTGFSIRTIEQLNLIHRLHQELDLDLETIDLIIHMRCQIIDLQEQLDQVERRARQREQKLLVELRELRRLLDQ
jgi:hypothetical protein